MNVELRHSPVNSPSLLANPIDKLQTRCRHVVLQIQTVLRTFALPNMNFLLGRNNRVPFSDKSLCRPPHMYLNQLYNDVVVVTRWLMVRCVPTHSTINYYFS